MEGSDFKIAEGYHPSNLGRLLGYGQSGMAHRLPTAAHTDETVMPWELIGVAACMRYEARNWVRSISTGATRGGYSPRVVLGQWG
jgi:hypothetical protein